MSEPDRTHKAFQELRSTVTPRIRRPGVEAAQRVVRRRHRRATAVISAFAAVLTLTAAGSLLRPSPPPGVLPTPGVTPSTTVAPTPTPDSTPSPTTAATQPATSPICTANGVARPSGPNGNMTTYTVNTPQRLCPGTRVRVIWATYSVVNVQQPNETRTLYRKGELFLDSDRSVITFAMPRPGGCWRGHVAFGNNLQFPTTIYGHPPPFGPESMIGDMQGDSTVCPVPTG